MRQLSGSVPARPSVRLMADLSGHYGSFAGASLRQTSHTTSKFEAASLSSGDTAWGGALGIGTGYRVARRGALRGHADYLLLHSGGGWDGDPRLSLGAAYHFEH